MGRRWSGLVLVWALAACNGADRLSASASLLVVEREQIDFGPVALPLVASQRLLLRNGGRTPVYPIGARIDGADAADFRVERLPEAPLGAGAALAIEIVFAPRTTGVRSARLLLEDDNGQAAVAIHGLGVLARTEVEPHFLDFGRIEIGATLALPLALSNPSMLPVRVEYLLDAAAPFSVAGPGRLAAAARDSAVVSFAPRGAGLVETTLQLSPCDGCEPIAIRLRGEGLDAALTVEPRALDFGALNVDRSKALGFQIRNESDLAVPLFRRELTSRTDVSFTLDPAVPLPTVVPPRGEVSGSVVFSPSHLGDAAGELELVVDSRSQPRLRVALRGRGGGPELGVRPAPLDFGRHAVGSRTVVAMRVQNDGGTTLPLTVRSLELAGDAALSASLPPLPIVLEAGAFLEVPIGFEPLVPGPFSAVLRLESNDAMRPRVEVPVSGRAELALPCELRVTPSRLDFGALPPGAGASLGVRVQNVGSDVCPVKNLQVESQPAGAFALGGRPPAGYELKPGGFFVRHLSFRPGPAGSYRGVFGFEIANPDQPRVEVPLSAEVVAGCLVFEPPFLDWGFVDGRCGVHPRVVTLTNLCSSPVVLERVAIGPGTSPDFAVVSTPQLPAPLDRWDSVDLTVAYAARTPGEALAPLQIASSEAAAPWLVPLLAESWDSGEIVDTFVQANPAALDVLFVVDNSESMVEEQPRIARAMEALVGAAWQLGMDLRAGVTTTGIDPVVGGDCPGGVGGGEAGRLFPVDRSAPRIIELQEPFAAEALAALASVGRCQSVEQPFEAMRRALSSPLVDSADDPRTPEPADGNGGLLRPEAALVVVIVSDEDDHSGASVAEYAKHLRGLKSEAGPGRLRVLAIAPTELRCATAGGFPGTRIAELVREIGGRMQDVCESDYGTALSAVPSLPAPVAQGFTLSEPAEPGTIRVVAGNVLVPEGSGWLWDAPSRQVRLAASPPPGTEVRVSYQPACSP